MANTPDELSDLFESVKKLLELWMRIKLVLIKAFGEGEVTREQETAYLQMKSEISRIYRTVSQRLTPGMQFDGDRMMELLKNAMTMEHLHQQPAAEQQGYYATWHAIYVRLTRTLGVLEAMKAGFHPQMFRTALKVPPMLAKSVQA